MVKKLMYITTTISIQRGDTREYRSAAAEPQQDSDIFDTSFAQLIEFLNKCLVIFKNFRHGANFAQGAMTSDFHYKKADDSD